MLPFLPSPFAAQSHSHHMDTVLWIVAMNITDMTVVGWNIWVVAVVIIIIVNFESTIEMEKYLKVMIMNISAIVIVTIIMKVDMQILDILVY